MKIDKDTIERWRKYIDLLLAENGLTTNDIDTPRRAWNVANRLDIPKEAYHIDKSVNDAHVTTALKRLFPNAWKQNKRSTK